jgi:hypothetical protein
MKDNFLMKPLAPGCVKYSCLARNVTLRETTKGIKIESLKERWLDAMITGPELGTESNPRTLGRKSKSRMGIKKDLSNRYGI